MVLDWDADRTSLAVVIRLALLAQTVFSVTDSVPSRRGGRWVHMSVWTGTSVAWPGSPLGRRPQPPEPSLQALPGSVPELPGALAGHRSSPRT